MQRNLSAFLFDSLLYTQNENMTLSTVSWLFSQASHWQNVATLENMIWFCSFQNCFNFDSFIRLVDVGPYRWPVFFLYGPFMFVNFILYLALFSWYFGTLVRWINPCSKIQFRNWNTKSSEYMYTVIQALPYWLFCPTLPINIWITNQVREISHLVYIAHFIYNRWNDLYIHWNI